MLAFIRNRFAGSYRVLSLAVSQLLVDSRRFSRAERAGRGERAHADTWLSAMRRMAFKVAATALR
jgi:hypothetical protein